MQENIGEPDGPPTRAEITLTKLFDDCHPADAIAPYQSRMRAWATSYLTAPHPELGRDGPVCPFTAASIAKETFWIGCVDRPGLTADDIEGTVASMISGFRRLPPTEGPDALIKTILILFPTVSNYSIIDESQKHLKEESVATGLMIGQFYPGCEEPGIRNREFRPLRSPIPLLAIRNMVSSDLPFLAANPQWIEEYLKRFSSSTLTSTRTAEALK